MTKKILKYSLMLIALGLISGFLLAFINSLTAPVIAARKKAEVKEALQEYFNYNEYTENKSGEYSDLDKSIREIYYAFDENGDLAAIIYQTAAQGYGGEVVSLIGIKADGTFDNAYMISGDKETSGIGSKVFEHDFDISDESTDDYSYEVLAGATITSSAVVVGIEAASTHFDTIDLGGIANE